MTFFGALYKIFIGPLELFFEILFVISNRLLDNLGLSIIVLSLVMNLLLLPLYKRADAIQDEQRETEKKLKKWVTHIKKTFTGDERFMMLQTYYRQNNYKPYSVLKGSVSLLLEIPFFIAAYNFLSNAGVFNGYSFGPFADFSQPDGLLKIGTLSINILPILMTAINIVSSIIYTKGLPASSKVQLYGMAGLFLILLYDSPACLVFYWTLNNLFSLVKNFFTKLKNPKFVLGIISSSTGILILFFVLFIHHFNSFKKNIFVIAVSLLLQLPLVIYFIKKNVTKKTICNINKNDKHLFILNTLFLTILSGVLIPSAVIRSSPQEFINTITQSNPLMYILNSALIAFGTFSIWCTMFYKLANNKGKNIICCILWGFSIISIINYIFFGSNKSNLSPLLIFDSGFYCTVKELLFNLFINILSIVIAFFIWKKRKSIVNILSFVIVIAIFGMSTFNIYHINNALKNVPKDYIGNNKDVPSISLSKTGKNVIVLMMDRAIGCYIPYIFNEKPEVAKQFEGFTYYPNTVSFGPFTNTGSPGLYGGYEYIPEEMNKRSDEPLVKKHNEALKVMPVIFDANGYDVTVCDPSYAGYDWIPDLSIYDEYPDIKKYRTMGNLYFGSSTEDYEMKKTVNLNRNLFLYSIMKIVPLLFQETLYSEGKYCSIKASGSQNCSSIHEAEGISDIFLKSYSVLDNLASITNICESGNKFLMMSNDTTHEPCLLQRPEYEPSHSVNNTRYDEDNLNLYTLNGVTMKMEEIDQVSHYQVNMAAMIKLGEFFDFMRENQVYDNTRIIIVADHGRNLHQFDSMVFGNENGEDAMFFNPLLLVKEFNQKEFKVDNTLMTNADTPNLAFTDVINDPINPFTNKKINNEKKYENKLNIFLSFDFSVDKNNGNTFLPGEWYSVSDNILDKNNWEKLY